MNEQVPHPSDSMSEDDIAASLGFATTLSEPLLPQDRINDTQTESPQENKGEPKEEPGNTSGQLSAEAEKKNDKILTELQGIRDDMKVVVAPKSVEQEVADIRKELETLKNEPNREDTSTGNSAQ